MISFTPHGHALAFCTITVRSSDTVLHRSLQGHVNLCCSATFALPMYTLAPIGRNGNALVVICFCALLPLLALQHPTKCGSEYCITAESKHPQPQCAKGDDSARDSNHAIRSNKLERRWISAPIQTTSVKSVICTITKDMLQNSTLAVMPGTASLTIVLKICYKEFNINAINLVLLQHKKAASRICSYLSHWMHT